MGEEEIKSMVPGQTVLPGMSDELGYEAIVLKPVQEKFCWEYVLRCDNGTRAYLAAKPSVKESTARVEASKLLTNPDVVGRIAQIRAELTRRYSVTAEDLVMYHGKVLKIDRSIFTDKKGKLKKIEDIDLEALSILDIHFPVDSKGKSQVLFEVPKRHGSAVELARMLGLHKEKLELMGEGGGPVEHLVADDVAKLDSLRGKFKGVGADGATSTAG